jgi:signal transduction histidine kinase/ActR/RegA family two-component response regulator
VALGWVGFSALEDIHLRGHQLQLFIDWSGHANAIDEEIQAVVVESGIRDPAARQTALAERATALGRQIDHLSQPPAHQGIALGAATVRQFGREYADQVGRIRTSTAALLAAAADPASDDTTRTASVQEAALAAQRAQLALAQSLQGNMQAQQNEMDLQHHTSLMALMGLVALAAVAGLLLGQAAAASITRPMGAVAAQLTRIGRGEFTQPVAVPNRDELGDLAARLNAMAAELERLYAVEREGRRVAETLNAQLAAQNRELEQVRGELQEATNALKARVAERTAELRDATEQLRQAQKMEAIGRLAGGVAHDFNNLLTVIQGFSELLQTKLAPGTPERAGVDEIAKASERAAALTHQLLAFSRRQVLAPEVLDLNAVLRDLEAMLGRLIGEDVELRLVLAPNLGRVRADPGQIQQVVMNLVVNARDAMPHGGQLTIETANVVADEEFLQRHGPVVTGPQVLLAVRDTGVGMDAETQSRIFEPFYTTKPVGGGTGLGLSTVYGVVQQSGGVVLVESAPGEGSSFRVYLPRVEADVAPPNGSRGASDAARGSETILLVEDEAQVRALVQGVLQDSGYTVLAASRGDEALGVAAAHAGEIDLLMTDVVMPGLGGRDVAARLAEQHPGLRVLYMSGYTNHAIGQHGVLDAETHFLQKPCTPAAIRAKVRQVLDGAAPQ